MILYVEFCTWFSNWTLNDQDLTPAGRQVGLIPNCDAAMHSRTFRVRRWHRKQVERMMAREEKRKDGGSSSLSSWAWHRGYSKTLLWSPQLPALFNFQSSFSSGTNSLETWVFVALDWSLYYSNHVSPVSRDLAWFQGYCQASRFL